MKAVQLIEEWYEQELQDLHELLPEDLTLAHLWYIDETVARPLGDAYPRDTELRGMVGSSPAILDATHLGRPARFIFARDARRRAQPVNEIASMLIRAERLREWAQLPTTARVQRSDRFDRDMSFRLYGIVVLWLGGLPPWAASATVQWSASPLN